MLDILARAGCYIAIIVLGNLLRRKGFFGEETFVVDALEHAVSLARDNQIDAACGHIAQRHFVADDAEVALVDGGLFVQSALGMAAVINTFGRAHSFQM